MLAIITVLFKTHLLEHRVYALILGPLILIKDLYHYVWKQSSDPLASVFNMAPITLLNKPYLGEGWAMEILISSPSYFEHAWLGSLLESQKEK